MCTLFNAIGANDNFIFQAQTLNLTLSARLLQNASKTESGRVLAGILLTLGGAILNMLSNDLNYYVTIRFKRRN